MHTYVGVRALKKPPGKNNSRPDLPAVKVTAPLTNTKTGGWNDCMNKTATEGSL